MSFLTPTPNPQNPRTKKWVYLGGRVKINTEKSILFIYTGNEQLEIKKVKCYFTIVPQNEIIRYKSDKTAIGSIHWKLRSVDERKQGKSKDMKRRGLPWWSSDGGSALQCEGPWFNPWSRKIPHAAVQLSPWATTTKYMGHNYWSLCA